MSVILTDMKMPNNCRECSFGIGKGDYVYCPKIFDEEYRPIEVTRHFKSRHCDCPLKSLDVVLEDINAEIYQLHREGILLGLECEMIDEIIDRYKRKG